MPEGDRIWRIRSVAQRHRLALLMLALIALAAPLRAEIVVTDLLGREVVLPQPGASFRARAGT